MKYLLSSVMILLFMESYCQRVTGGDSEKNRADAFFDKVWKKYRLDGHPGLFSEHYPRGEKTELDYFQGANVREKEASFLWPLSGMCSAANVLIKFPDLKEKYSSYLDTLAIGLWTYRDSIRKPIGYQAYPAKFEKADRYYDDNALVCIDYCESFQNTKKAIYSKKAIEVFNFIISGWDGQLGGGVYWLEGHQDQKPACSNGMATLAALKLYQTTGNKVYLEWGKRFYDWMHSSLRNPQGIYYNDMKMDGKPNPTYYTYNTGSMLEASVMLYKLTGKTKYLTEAQLLAKNAFNFFSSEISGRRRLSIDLPWFVTVLFRAYQALYEIDKNPEYIKAITYELNEAWQNSMDKYGLLSAKWLNDKQSKEKPKWLLDEACVAELYARIGLLSMTNKE